MKHIASSLTLLSLLLALSLYSGCTLNNLTDQCIGRLEQAHQQAMEDNWDSARQLTRQALTLWEEHSFSVHALLRHAEADEILISFHCLEQYLQIEELDQYIAANAQLMLQLELAAEVERPSWENVL